MKNLEERIEKLENQNKFFKRVSFVSLSSFVIMFIAGFNQKIQLPDIIEAQMFVLKDYNGKTTSSWSNSGEDKQAEINFYDKDKNKIAKAIDKNWNDSKFELPDTIEAKTFRVINEDGEITSTWANIDSSEGAHLTFWDTKKYRPFGDSNRNGIVSIQYAKGIGTLMMFADTNQQWASVLLVSNVDEGGAYMHLNNGKHGVPQTYSDIRGITFSTNNGDPCIRLMDSFEKPTRTLISSFGYNYTDRDSITYSFGTPYLEVQSNLNNFSMFPSIFGGHRGIGIYDTRLSEITEEGMVSYRNDYYLSTFIDGKTELNLYSNDFNNYAKIQVDTNSSNATLRVANGNSTTLLNDKNLSSLRLENINSDGKVIELGTTKNFARMSIINKLNGKDIFEYILASEGNNKLNLSIYDSNKNLRLRLGNQSLIYGKGLEKKFSAGKITTFDENGNVTGTVPNE